MKIYKERGCVEIPLHQLFSDPTSSILSLAKKTSVKNVWLIFFSAKLQGVVFGGLFRFRNIASIFKGIRCGAELCIVVYDIHLQVVFVFEIANPTGKPAVAFSIFGRHFVKIRFDIWFCKNHLKVVFFFCVWIESIKVVLVYLEYSTIESHMFDWFYFSRLNIVWNAGIRSQDFLQIE